MPESYLNRCKIADSNTVESFVFIANDGIETQLICIDGTMNRSDLESLIAKAID